ncbi:hypothetical protein NM208_g7702 [Fusarium decemcellulare]|uniref:Uncharacterized protein n=1 Tax=Fusarium decemcellulare TaxID=57161 RepID=A0ACC1S8D5_9HYPO|nr:hypothetical protein NM208_g7702 [Fusarium decemcellulare]
MDLTKPRPNDEEALATALKEVTFWPPHNQHANRNRSEPFRALLTLAFPSPPLFPEVHSPHLPVCKYTVAIGLGYLKPDPEDSGPDDERATPMTRQVSFLAKACNRIQEVNNRFPTRGEVIDLFNFK